MLFSESNDSDDVSRAFSIDHSGVVSPEPIEHSSSTATLLNELQKAKEDLKYKYEQMQRAYEMRQNTDREIEDLTASLFEVRFQIELLFPHNEFPSPHIRWSNKRNMLKPILNKSSELPIKQ